MAEMSRLQVKLAGSSPWSTFVTIASLALMAIARYLQA